MIPVIRLFLRRTGGPGIFGAALHPAHGGRCDELEPGAADESSPGRAIALPRTGTGWSSSASRWLLDGGCGVAEAAASWEGGRRGLEGAPGLGVFPPCSCANTRQTHFLCSLRPPSNGTTPITWGAGTRSDSADGHRAARARAAGLRRAGGAQGDEEADGPDRSPGAPAAARKPGDLERILLHHPNEWVSG